PPQVYMMTAMLAKGLDMATKLLRLGAKDFISKPFSDNGRKLTKIIEGVLSTTETEPELRNHVSKVAELPAPYTEPNNDPGEFAGGELVIEKDRITLCGHTVLSTARSTRIVRILEVLNQRTRVGAWVAKSGPELASELGGSAGEPAVVSAIYNFRKALTDVLRTQVGVEADNQTIVCSGGTGYRFSDLVTVRDARNAVAAEVPEVETPASRQELILTLLRQSGKMRSTNIASKFGCSLRTVKRELDTFLFAGSIDFVGPSKTGTYRSVGT
ncbi:MAG: hypothetical protein ACKO9Q_14955, partial [Pirellula sp.]